MTRDIIILGAVIGLLADAVKLIVNYMLFLLNYTSVVFWQIAASRFLEKDELFGPAAYFIGGVADITITAVLGVIFILFIYISGKDYLWIKGIGFGLSVWVILFGTLLGQTAQAKLPQDPVGIIVTIVAHLVFGLGLAGFTRLLYVNQRVEATKKKEETRKHIIPVPVKKILILGSEDNVSEDCVKESQPRRKSKKTIKIWNFIAKKFKR